MRLLKKKILMPKKCKYSKTCKKYNINNATCKDDKLARNYKGLWKPANCYFDNKIVYRKYKHGIGSRVNNIIYLHEALFQRRWTKLKNAVIKHEKKHSDGINIHDLFLDIKSDDDIKKVKLDYYKFLIKNPNALRMFLPLRYFDKEFHIDILTLGMWLVFLVFVIILYKLNLFRL